MRSLSAVLMLICSLAWTVGAARAAPGDTTADSALGQPDFTQNMPNPPAGLPTAANLSLVYAAHVAVAPNGRLYVSDPGNHRVLSWPSASAFSIGQPADFVLGQPDFVSGLPNSGGISPRSLNLPQGLCVDAGGNVWLADAFNHRVLKFNNPTTDATPLDADLVIGQFDLFSNLENLGLGGTGPDVARANSIQYPGRVVVIGPDVFVADSGNSRVLHYATPVSNTPAADRVFGQFDNLNKRAKNNDGAGNNGCCALPGNLFNPIGIAVDPAGRLYIADWNNHRLLRYDAPLSTDTIADAVFGQPDLFGRDPDNGGLFGGLQLPIDLAFDSTGRLFVVDSGNNRLLTYDQPLSSLLPNAVFGQLGSFTTEAPNHGLGEFLADADGLFGPTGVAIDALGHVYVADTNNNRILRYDRPLTPRGDLNCDGVRDAGDAAALALALVNPTGFTATYPGCDIGRADLNGDGRRDGADVQSLLSLLIGP